MTTYPKHPSSLYRVRIGLTVAAAGALLAACGGSSKTASTGTVTNSSAPSASTSSAAAPSTAASSSGPVSADLGGGSFCDKAKTASANVASATGDLATDTPAKLKQFEGLAVTELQALKGEAPSAIKGPITTLADTEQKLYDDLSAANFDFTKINPELVTQFSTPQFMQAITQIDSYLETKCGINPTAVPTS